MALYFAATSENNKDGAIWAVEPRAHADRMPKSYPGQFINGARKFPMPPIRYGYFPDGTPAAESLFNIAREKEALDAHLDKLSAELGTSLQFFPCKLPNERMSNQHGWFSCASLVDTDHGEAIARAFENHAGRWWAQRFIVQRESKGKILRELYRANINGESVFRGLDGLGRAASELVDVLSPDEYEYTFEEGLLAATTRPSGPDSPPRVPGDSPTNPVPGSDVLNVSPPIAETSAKLKLGETERP